MDWCPETLLDISQLDNYYNQQRLEEAYMWAESKRTGFPGAIYINAVMGDGSIRTGTSLPWGRTHTQGSTPEGLDSADSGYAYCPTLVAWNIKKACGLLSTTTTTTTTTATAATATTSDSECEELVAIFEEQRTYAPMKLWNDPVYGRLTDWSG
jgi:hypothetical protein